MERQSKGSRGLEAYCKGRQDPPRAVAPLKKKKKKRSNTQKWITNLCNYTTDILYWGYVVVQWVEALRYKPTGGGFNS